MNRKDKSIIFICFILLGILIFTAVGFKDLEQQNERLQYTISQLEFKLNELEIEVAKRQQYADALYHFGDRIDKNVKALDNLLKGD